MYDYLRSRGIFMTSQSAFQKLFSTITSLINSTKFWYENIDHQQVNLVIFLDLEKQSLGVIIEQGLSWEDHFKVIKAKLRRGLFKKPKKTFFANLN